MLYYFAYGSNLHPVRLSERVPSASLLGTVVLEYHSLAFHKESHDGSSKCNLLASDSASDVVHGALYTLAPEHKTWLDAFEGNGSGYTDNLINVRYHERDYTCFTYQAQPSHIVDHLQPYHWYKELVLQGARYLRFPDNYLASINAVQSMGDPDVVREKQHDALLKKIRAFPDEPLIR